MIMSEKKIEQQYLKKIYELATINKSHSNQKKENQLFICKSDIINIMTGSNGETPLTISDTWQGIVQDLFGI